MMLTRLIIAGATIVALGAPSVQAGPVHHHLPFFWLCGLFTPQKQCAIQLDLGDDNTARTDQTLTKRGLQYAFTVQHGNNNNAYTGQTGSNEIAMTFQNGNNNTAFTSQAGHNQISVTSQSGSQGGMWAATSSAGTDTVTTVVQSN